MKNVSVSTRRPAYAPARPPVVPLLVAAVSLVWIVFWFGALPRWPQVLIPVSVAVYGFVGLLWVRWRGGPWPYRALRVALVVIGAHLALWLPYLLAACLAGDGATGLGRALPGALVSAVAVAWYVLSAHLWQTLAIILGLSLLMLPGRRAWRRMP